jgi:N utilization substance protein A
VQEDQLSLAIGRRGQNVRLASKLVGWDIEIMTLDEYNDSITKAETWFLEVPHMTPEAVEGLILEGFLSLDDLGNCIEAEDLAEIAGVTVEQAQEMVDYAEEKADELGEEAVRTPRSAVDAEGRSLATPKPNPAAEARKILGDTAPAARESVPTFEQLFREKAGPAAEPAAEAAAEAAPEPQPEAEPAPEQEAEAEPAPAETVSQEEVPPPAEPVAGEAPAASESPESPALVEQTAGEAETSGERPS